MYIFSASERANYSLLKALAHRSGGHFFNISNNVDLSQIQSRIEKQSWKFLGGKFENIAVEEGLKM